MRTVTAAVSEHALAPLPFRCDPCPRTRQHRPYERTRCALVAAVAAAEGSVGGSAVEGSAVAAATVAAAVAKAAAATVAARADEAALSAAAEAAAACSRGGGAAVCGRLRRWRWVMAVAVEEEDVRRSRRRSWRAPPPAPQQRAALRSGPTCAQRSASQHAAPDARSNVGVGLRLGVHTFVGAP